MSHSLSEQIIQNLVCDETLSQVSKIQCTTSTTFTFSKNPLNQKTKATKVFAEGNQSIKINCMHMSSVFWLTESIWMSLELYSCIWHNFVNVQCCVTMLPCLQCTVQYMHVKNIALICYQELHVLLCLIPNTM